MLMHRLISQSQIGQWKTILLLVVGKAIAIAPTILWQPTGRTQKLREQEEVLRLGIHIVKELIEDRREKEQLEGLSIQHISISLSGRQEHSVEITFFRAAGLLGN